jgi:hypothetical protein
VLKSQKTILRKSNLAVEKAVAAMAVRELYVLMSTASSFAMESLAYKRNELVPRDAPLAGGVGLSEGQHGAGMNRMSNVGRAHRRRRLG